METAQDLQARVAIRESPRLLAFGIASAWLTAAAMWDGSRDIGYTTRVFVWAALLSLALARGILLARAHQGAPVETLATSTRRIQINSAATALLWGLSSSFLLPAADMEHEAILILGIGLVIVVSAAGPAQYLAWVQYLVLIASTSFALGLLAIPGQMHFYVGLAFLVFGPVIARFSRTQSAVLRKERELNLEIEHLLQNSKRAREDAELARVEAERTGMEARQASRKALAAMKVAEEATRSKQRLLASVSHDLRQPLHALVQYVAHLDKLCTEERIRPTVDRIQTAVDSMEELLNAVFDFSRISSSQFQPYLECLNVDKVLHRLENQIRPVAEAKGLLLRVESCGGHVLCDEALLDRVLWNIAQNAVRYTRVGAVVVRARVRSEGVRFTIADSGIGIPQSEICKIFDEYYQVGNQERNRQLGLGLGLAIVRDLASLLDTRIQVRSKVGAGTTFTIDVEAANSPRVLPVEGETILRLEHIIGSLVVCIDDDHLAADALATTLQDLGCQVVLAHSAGEALELVTRSEIAPQLVVTDFCLPGGSTGLDAISVLRSRQQQLYGEEFPLRAVVISGDTSPETELLVRNAGYPMLRKPVGVRELCDALDTVLRG